MEFRKSGKQLKAFTLIELLVVIAIIAILAAILFPVFATAREKARQTSCLSNQKQLALGIIQYTQDYDEYLPNGVSQTNQPNGWAGQIYQYIKSANVYVCPSDVSNNPVCSYVYNRNTLNQNQPAACPGNFYCGMSWASYPVSQLGAPARTVLLAEVAGCGGNWVIYNPSSNSPKGDNVGANVGFSPTGNGLASQYDPYAQGNLAGNLPCTTAGGCAAGTFTLQYATGYPYNFGAAAAYATGYVASIGRHNGGANYVMSDGHAKYFQGSQVFAGSNNGTVGACSSATSGQAMNTQCGTSNIGATWSIF